VTRIVLSFTLAVLLLTGCGQHDSAATAPPSRQVTSVRTARAESVQLPGAVRSVGVLEPRDEMRLSFKVGGVLDTVAVDVGDRVRRGQLLATIKRAEVDAAVSQAGEAAEKARRDLERGQRLKADEVATEEQVQDLATAYSVARSNLDTARFNARYARIEAPDDGVVLQRLAEASELVQPGQPVLVLGGSSGGWIVRTALADRDAVRVDAGDAAAISFDAFPGREFAGRVTRVGSSADPSTGTFDVEIQVTADGARFARGLVAKVSLIVRDSDQAAPRTLVPVTAIVEANGAEASVYVLDPGANVARRKRITVGSIVGDRVVVSAGLEAGELVITDGAAWLADGSPVRVVGQPG
jgi:membrane fusion protein, multidrug efflux system